MEPQIGFCTNGVGSRIAYATWGQGPAMVVPPSYFAAITPFKTLPESRNFFNSLGRYHTVVIYDPHGAGLSDRNRTVFTLESELRDLETVVDHLKINNLILYGAGMSGPIAIAYAARYPGRVTHLVLYGSYANYGKFVEDEMKTSVVSMIRQPNNWLGRRAITNLAGPQIDMNYVELFIGIVKDSITPEVAGHVIDMFYKLDVTHLCPLIKTPTLVMHRKVDRLIDFKAGLELAALIPDVRFVQLEGNLHFYFLGDTESVLHNIFEFLNDPLTSDKAAKAAHPTTKKSGHDVFISFAFEDREPAAKIHAHLRASGICPFWCEDITAGGDYPQLLGEAIRNSKSFLLVLSDAADNSASVRKETTIAHNNRIPVIPVRINNILPKNLEYLVANSLFFDAFPQPLEQHLPGLTSDVKKIVGGKADKKENIKK